MHEMRFIDDLFNDLLMQAGKHKVRKVTKVFLAMGEFTEINEEIIRFLFEKRSRGSVVEGAGLCIEKSSGRKLELVSFDCK